MGGGVHAAVVCQEAQRERHTFMHVLHRQLRDSTCGSAGLQEELRRALSLFNQQIETGPWSQV